MKKLRWFVYVVEASDGSLYTGIARDLEKRIGLHENGKGSRYLRGRSPYRVVHREIRYGLSSALKREAAIKKLSKKKKQELIGEGN